MKNRLTQPEAAFYILWKNKKKGGNRFIPVHEFMGEVFCEEVGMWGYISYECSARLSEMYKDNPGLLERESITGKSGATYYGYRIHPQAIPGHIKDLKIGRLFQRLRSAQQP